MKLRMCMYSCIYIYCLNILHLYPVKRRSTVGPFIFVFRNIHRLTHILLIIAYCWRGADGSGANFYSNISGDWFLLNICIAIQNSQLFRVGVKRHLGDCCWLDSPRNTTEDEMIWLLESQAWDFWVIFLISSVWTEGTKPSCWMDPLGWY